MAVLEAERVRRPEVPPHTFARRKAKNTFGTSFVAVRLIRGNGREEKKNRRIDERERTNEQHHDKDRQTRGTIVAGSNAFGSDKRLQENPPET